MKIINQISLITIGLLFSSNLMAQNIENQPVLSNGDNIVHSSVSSNKDNTEPKVATTNSNKSTSKSEKSKTTKKVTNEAPQLTETGSKKESLELENK